MRSSSDYGYIPGKFSDTTAAMIAAIVLTLLLFAIVIFATLAILYGDQVLSELFSQSANDLTNNGKEIFN